MPQDRATKEIPIEMGNMKSLAVEVSAKLGCSIEIVKESEYVRFLGRSVFRRYQIHVCNLGPELTHSCVIIIKSPANVKAFLRALLDLEAKGFIKGNTL